MVTFKSVQCHRCSDGAKPGRARSNDLAGRSTALAPPCLLLCFGNSVNKNKNVTTSVHFICFIWTVKQSATSIQIVKLCCDKNLTELRVTCVFLSIRQMRKLRDTSTVLVAVIEIEWVLSYVAFVASLGYWLLTIHQFIQLTAVCWHSDI